MMKERIILMIFMLILIDLSNAMYMGTVDGWIKLMDGSVVNASNVHITVNGCSSTNCNSSVVSDENGYYLVDNLNMNPGDNVTVTAHITLSGHVYSGINVGTANSASVATVNVTLCTPPSLPILTHQDNISYNYVDLYWISGSDPDGYSTYNIYQFNTVIHNDSTSPQHESGLSPGLYVWKVKTCNNLCCSNWSEDSFYVVTPSQPTLTHQPDIHNSNVSLYWTSGVDPEGLSVYDDFIFDSSTISHATSPENVTGIDFGSHTWGVRTCNTYFCSPWATDTFHRYNNLPSEPILNPIPDGNYSCVNLTWISGSDPDGDTVYDQVTYGPVLSFTYSNYTNATSPYMICNVSGTYQWAVRTCDEYGLCSPWNVSYFTSSQCPVCPSCTNVTRTEQIVEHHGLFALISFPNLIAGGSEFLYDVKLINIGDTPIEVSVDFDSDHLNLNGFTHRLSQDEEYMIEMTGVAENVTDGIIDTVISELHYDDMVKTIDTDVIIQPVIPPENISNINCDSNYDCPNNAYCHLGICTPVICPESMVVYNHGCILSTFGCNSSYDCEDYEVCEGHSCVPVNCSCGYVTNHECHPYQCCYDSDCGSGFLCIGHECQQALNNVEEYINTTNILYRTLNNSLYYLTERDQEKIKSILKKSEELIAENKYKEAYKLLNEGMSAYNNMDKDALRMVVNKYNKEIILILLVLILTLLFEVYHWIKHGPLTKHLFEDE